MYSTKFYRQWGAKRQVRGCALCNMVWVSSATNLKVPAVVPVVWLLPQNRRRVSQLNLKIPWTLMIIAICLEA